MEVAAPTLLLLNKIMGIAAMPSCDFGFVAEKIPTEFCFVRNVERIGVTNNSNGEQSKHSRVEVNPFFTIEASPIGNGDKLLSPRSEILSREGRKWTGRLHIVLFSELVESRIQELYESFNCDCIASIWSLGFGLVSKKLPLDAVSRRWGFPDIQIMNVDVLSTCKWIPDEYRDL